MGAAQGVHPCTDPSCYAAGVYDLAELNAAPVDILVATPGRLMAHLKGTPGASLKHLRYLVRPQSSACFMAATAGVSSGLQRGCPHASRPTFCRSLLAGSARTGSVERSSVCQVVDEADRLLRQTYQDWLPFVVAAAGAQQAQQAAGSAVLKFVASATLTRDPAKIERLGLHCPRYLALEAADTRWVLRGMRPTEVLQKMDSPQHAGWDRNQ